MERRSCPVQGCLMTRDTTCAARKEHCRAHHGYPVCGMCKKEIRSITLFEQHLSQEHEMDACPLCFALIVKNTLKTHMAVRHGYPNCLVCDRRNILNYGNFVAHVLTHESHKCRFGHCDAEFAGQSQAEEAHYREVHGFPECMQCGKSFMHLHTFVEHVDTHKPIKCCFTGCDAEFARQSQAEEAHYREVHSYPACGRCGKTFPGFFNFSTHTTHCGQGVSTLAVVPLCVYSGCADGVWTLAHLSEAHDGLRCSNCEKLLSTIHTLKAHVQQCEETCPRVPAHVCDKCHAVLPSSHVLRHHVCLPPTPPSMHVLEYLRLTEQHCTQLEVCNERDNLTYHVTARIRRSSVECEPIREYTLSQLKMLKLDQDPTSLEVMEPGTLPLPIFFMPPHLHFELRMRMLYELEFCQPASAFYLMLMYRVMNLCDDPSGRDILYFQRLVESTPLPPGVAEECRHLLVARAQVKHMWTRARQHRHIKVFMYSVNGQKHVLRSQLRKIDEAVRADRRLTGQGSDNWDDDEDLREAMRVEMEQAGLIPEVERGGGRKVARVRWPQLGEGREEEKSEEEVLDKLEEEEGEEREGGCRRRVGNKRRMLPPSYGLHKRRARFTGAVSKCDSQVAMDSEEIPVAVSELVSVPRCRREASGREVEWQELLYYFFHRILRPVVRSRMVVRMQSHMDVKEQFLDNVLYMVADGPPCRLPEHMNLFLTKLVKSEASDMSLLSLQPNVRMPGEFGVEESEEECEEAVV